jgi:ABC-2 type transport system ATP-binding protein
MKAIEFDNVVKKFDNGVLALDGLTLTVPAGTIFGFLGLNGAGKTTSIRILAGLDRQDSGSVNILGKSLQEHGCMIKRRLGFVLDQPVYFDWMTPREYLEFIGAMYGLEPGQTKSRTDELIEFFDLTDDEDRTINTFSTGMKKKTSLAAAIIHAPSLLILDEPLEGIDAVVAASIRETLRVLASRGTTVFITSHVMETVEQLCSEIAIINSGRVVLQCPTSSIRQMARKRTANSPAGEDASNEYAGLEDLFIDVVSERVRKKTLPYLRQ